jgi:hypothetical protein
MDLREKIKRERDEYQDLLAWAHAQHPAAADPVKELNKWLEAEGFVDETDRAEAEELSQDYASVHELLEGDRIDPGEANRLLDVLDVRSKARTMRIAERMAERWGVDVKNLIPDEDGEK